MPNHNPSMEIAECRGVNPVRSHVDSLSRKVDANGDVQDFPPKTTAERPGSNALNRELSIQLHNGEPTAYLAMFSEDSQTSTTH